MRLRTVALSPSSAATATRESAAQAAAADTVKSSTNPALNRVNIGLNPRLSNGLIGCNGSDVIRALALFHAVLHGGLPLFQFTRAFGSPCTTLPSTTVSTDRIFLIPS